MSREAVTSKIVAAKVAKSITWAEVAKKVGQSKEWSTAACLGQMQLTAAQAKAVGKLFDLSADDILWLQRVPYKGALPTAVPTDPLIYRFYELVNVYGTTLKELIHEEFGDGIIERDRLLHGRQARAGSQGRSRAHRHERQVSAVQDLLTDCCVRRRPRATCPAAAPAIPRCPTRRPERYPDTPETPEARRPRATASACLARLHGSERFLGIDQRASPVGRFVGVVAD
jgi:cyanate lyase